MFLGKLWIFDSPMEASEARKSEWVSKQSQGLTISSLFQGYMEVDTRHQFVDYTWKSGVPPWHSHLGVMLDQLVILLVIEELHDVSFTKQRLSFRLTDLTSQANCDDGLR